MKEPNRVLIIAILFFLSVITMGMVFEANTLKIIGLTNLTFFLGLFMFRNH